MKTFYRLNASRVTFREYAYDNPWPVVVPVAGLIKLFRISIPNSSDDPPVETLTPFEIQEVDLPEEIHKRFAPLTDELAELGFGQPIFHQIYCALQHTYIYWATFAHATGRAAARIHHRVWSQQTIHKSYLFPVFISEMSDGSFLVSSAGRRDMAAPKSVEVEYHKGASAAELWEEHQDRLDDQSSGQPVDIRTQDRLRQMVERHHATLRDFHLDRGVFRPVAAELQAKLVEQGETKLAASAGASVEDAVLARLESQRKQKPSWMNFFVVLGISLVAFLAAGFKDMDRKFLWLIVPILLFHELGHYVAMRAFGYRNLRMFFIPFFGAAVAGKHYNIAGWKKALVALAGPVPGIFVGGMLGIVGLVMHQPKVVEVAMLMVIVNSLNLLPFLPLDGGWVLHAVLFCRHPLLDLAFRLVAVFAFFGLSLLTGGYLYVLGIPLLISLPVAWHVANVAHRLQSRKGLAVSPDGLSIPEDSARVILAELGAGKHSRKPANVLAQQVTSVFETLNARPPDVLASVGLLGVHGGTFFLALVFSVVFLLFRPGSPFAERFANRFANRIAFEEAPMQYRFTPGNADQWVGKETTFQNEAAPAGKAPGIPPPSLVTFVASYADEATARAEFAEMSALDRAMGPGHGAAVGLFGQTVVVTLSKDDENTRKRWKDRLDQTAKEVAVGDKNSFLVFRLSCTMPSEQEADQLVQELDAYFLFARPDLLLPAWSPALAALPPAQQESLQKARHTLGQLVTIARRAYQEPEVKEVNREQVASRRSRDPQKIRELVQRQVQAMHAAEERLLAEIAADKAESDQVVVELWQRLTKIQKDMQKAARDPDHTAGQKKIQAFQQQQEVLHQELARRAGSLGLAVTNPETNANVNSYSASAGIRQTGRTISINSLQFRCFGLGLPAFGEWLARQHASDIQYGYEADPLDLPLGLDED